jgi:hypothetical protein
MPGVRFLLVLGVMKNLILAKVIVLLAMTAVCAQTNRDVCHVYIIDSQLAERAFENITDEEAQSKAIKIIGEFSPKIYEDEQTTKHFRFPGSNLVITASVLYTDELMGSKNTQDSMVVGVAVTNKAEKSALGVMNNAVAEVTYGKNTDKVRAKKFVKVGGRAYLVGLECECNVESPRK